MKIFGLNINKRNGEGIVPENPSFINIFGVPSDMQGGAMLLSAVYRSVNLIADSVAVLPIVTEYDATQNIFDNIRHMSRYQWLRLICQSIMLNGNAFTFIRRQNGVPVELVYLTPQSVTINYDEVTDRLTYQVVNKSKINIVQPQDMLHFRKFSYNGIEGKSIIAFAKNAIGISKQTEDSASDYFSNSFRGFLTTEDNLSPDKQKEIENNFSYFLKTKTAGVLTGGLQFQELRKDSANDSQLIDAREFNVEDIARFFGIPQCLLTGKQGAYNSLTQAQNEFYKRTLQPYITLIEEELTKKLMENINLDEKAMLRMDGTEEANYINTLLTNGVLSINEARAMLDLEPIANGDKHIIAYTKISDNTIEGNEDNKE